MIDGIDRIHTIDAMGLIICVGIILSLYELGTQHDKTKKIRRIMLLITASIIGALWFYLERWMPYGGGGW